MKCHYDVLDVSRDADDATIKVAYRKLALRWHPDKNLNNLDEAKTKFQTIQQAYEVLSDAQERAWYVCTYFGKLPPPPHLPLQTNVICFCFSACRYDRHREQILRGSHEYSDESLDVFQYFTASCYRGFDDSAGGFYAVYRDVFEKLATEDLDFIDSDDEETIPTFGMANSDYEAIVGPFYAYWSAYCTQKSYAWLCPHNVQEIRDRRVLRHIEKDTKKLAQKARRERNDEVRALVAFVKKRDRRVIEYRKVLEERSALNRQKQDEKRLAQIRRNQAEVAEMREKQKNGIGFAVDHEEQLRKLEAEYRSGSSDDSEHDDDDAELVERLTNGIDLENTGDKAKEEVEVASDYVDHLYCVACFKSFKNEMTMKMHEDSRKHRENITRLRMEMLDEDDAYEDDESTENSCTDSVLKSEKEGSDESCAEDVDYVPPIIINNKIKKKKKNVIQDADEQPLEEHNTTKSESSVRVRKQKKQKKLSNDPAVAADERKAVNAKLISTTNNDAATSDVDDDWSDGGAKKTTKKKAKKAKRAKGLVPMAPVIDDEMDVNHTCVTCKASFDSKNKLFAHLKKVGHGVYIEGKGIVAPARSASKTKNK